MPQKKKRQAQASRPRAARSQASRSRAARSRAARSQASRKKSYQSRQDSVSSAPFKAPKKKSGIDYAERIKLISPFVNLGIKKSEKLTPKKKALVTKLFNQVSQSGGIGNARFVKIRSQKNKDKVARMFGNEIDSKYFKGAFVPVSKIGTQGKINFGKDGSFSITVPDVEGFPVQKYFEIDAKKFAKRGADYIKELIADMPDNQLFAPVSATAGPLIGSVRTPQGFQRDKQMLIDLMNKWIDAYTVTGVDKNGKKKKGHEMKDWLTGIQVIEQPNTILE